MHLAVRISAAYFSHADVWLSSGQPVSMPPTTPAYQPLPTQDSPNASSENLYSAKQTPSSSRTLRVLLFVLALVAAALVGYSLRGFVVQKPVPPLNSDISKPSPSPTQPTPPQSSDMSYNNGKFSVG